MVQGDSCFDFTQLLRDIQADWAGVSLGEGEQSTVAAEDVVTGNCVWHVERLETDGAFASGWS